MLKTSTYRNIAKLLTHPRHRNQFFMKYFVKCPKTSLARYFVS